MNMVIVCTGYVKLYRYVYSDMIHIDVGICNNGLLSCVMCLLGICIFYGYCGA